MRFKNREEAAAPRGAVLMAKIIADELEGELNVVLVHKLAVARACGAVNAREVT